MSKKEQVTGEDETSVFLNSKVQISFEQLPQQIEQVESIHIIVTEYNKYPKNMGLSLIQKNVIDENANKWSTPNDTTIRALFVVQNENDTDPYLFNTSVNNCFMILQTNSPRNGNELEQLFKAIMTQISRITTTHRTVIYLTPMGRDFLLKRRSFANFMYSSLLSMKDYDVSAIPGYHFIISYRCKYFQDEFYSRIFSDIWSQNARIPALQRRGILPLFVKKFYYYIYNTINNQEDDDTVLNDTQLLTDHVLRVISTRTNDNFNRKFLIFLQFLHTDESIIDIFIRTNKIRLRTSVSTTITDKLIAVIFYGNETNFSVSMQLQERDEQNETSTDRFASSSSQSDGASSTKSSASTRASDDISSVSREIKIRNRHFSVPYEYNIRKHNVSTHSLSFREITRYIPPIDKYYISHFLMSDIKKFIHERFDEVKDTIEDDGFREEMKTYIDQLDELSGYDYIKNMGIVPLYDIETFKAYKRKNNVQNDVRNMYKMFPTTVLQAWYNYCVTDSYLRSSSTGSIKTRQGLIDFFYQDNIKGRDHWEIPHRQFLEWFEEFSKVSDIQVLEKSTEKHPTASQNLQKQNQETDNYKMINMQRKNFSCNGFNT